jgi:hypothetical protein
MVLFPVFFLLECGAVWLAAGPLWAAVAAIVLPFAGISSLLLLEYAAWREMQARELLALLFVPGTMKRLRAERNALVADFDRLATAFADNPVR